MLEFPNSIPFEYESVSLYRLSRYRGYSRLERNLPCFEGYTRLRDFNLIFVFQSETARYPLLYANRCNF